MKVNALIVLSLALPFVADAKGGGSPQNGVGGVWKFQYKTPGGEDTKGEMHLVRDKDVACGVYKYSDSKDWIGWASFAVKGDEIDGTYYETQNPSTWKFKITKDTFGGSYKESSDPKSADVPMTAKFDGANTGGPKSINGTWALDYESEKCDITFKQTGSAVTGKAVYKYSGEPCGEYRGTIQGDLLVGEYKQKEDTGHFFLQFRPVLNSSGWVVKGAWGTTRESPFSCDNGGKITGEKTK